MHSQGNRSNESLVTNSSQKHGWSILIIVIIVRIDFTCFDQIKADHLTTVNYNQQQLILWIVFDLTMKTHL